MVRNVTDHRVIGETLDEVPNSFVRRQRNRRKLAFSRWGSSRIIKLCEFFELSLIYLFVSVIFKRLFRLVCVCFPSVFLCVLSICQGGGLCVSHHTVTQFIHRS